MYRLFIHFISRNSFKSCARVKFLIIYLIESLLVSNYCKVSACNSTVGLLSDWPCEWMDGKIPFVFNFYSSSPKRMMSLVRKGLKFIEQRSCLVFEEHDPVALANTPNATYLYFSYSGALEHCCLPFWTKKVGRRQVVITPTCTMPAEVAHATLHGMGLTHSKKDSFSDDHVKQALYLISCPNIKEKIRVFDSQYSE